MLFEAAFRRELGRSFAATLVVVLTIVLSMMLIRTMSQAAQGQVGLQDVLLLLGFSTLAHLGTMVTLSLYVALVLVLGRMGAASELAVWFSSGVPLTRFLRPLGKAVLPMCAVVAALWWFAWPWVNEQSAALRERYQQRSDLSRVNPGVFQTSADGQRVFFIDKLSLDSDQARHVFVLNQLPQQESITSSALGQVDVTPEGRRVTLTHGHRQETLWATGERSRAEFDTYEVLLPDRPTVTGSALAAKATASVDLWQAGERVGMGELAWRAGMSLGAINLLLFAVGLTQVNNRQSSNWNLILALLGFVIYTNLINLTQAWVSSGKVSFAAALVGLHGGFFVVGCLMVQAKVYGIAWSARWRRPVRPERPLAP